MTTTHQIKRLPTVLLIALSAVACLLGCVAKAPGEIPGLTNVGFEGVGSLPEDTRRASSLEQIDGSPPESSGDGTAVENTSLRIDSTGFEFSFGRYVFGLPLDATLLGLDLDVEEVTSEYWVALSGYGSTGGWEWQGPFTGDTRIDFDASFANYLSPNDNLYWVVLTTDENSLLLVDTTVDYEPWHIQFRVPPTGQQVAVPSPAGAPSMVLMPQIEDWSDEGAPVIIYTATVDTNPYIYFAYYNGTQWKQRELLSGGPAMSQPQAIWTGSGGTVFAYDHSAGAGGTGQVVKIRLDNTWAFISSQIITAVEGKSLMHLKVDYDPQSGDYLVLHAYSVDPTHEIYISKENSGGWQTVQHTSFTGDKIAGADVSFDPAGGDPWAVFSSGTIDESTTIILDFRLNMGRFDGADWNWSTLDNEEPLTVDLGFQEDNTAQLVMISVRDWTFSRPIPPINITASILADISVGVDVGLGWQFTTLHTSEVDISNIFDFQLGVDLGVDCAWANEGALSFANADGFIGFSMSPFAITDGTLTNQTSYFVDGAGGYESSSWFTGGPGVAFSWQRGAPGLMCAYLYADELDIAQALGGSVSLENDIIFWRP